MVEAHPADLRVAIIASGHLANAIGGPNMAAVHPGAGQHVGHADWDQIIGGDTPTLVEETTYESLAALGPGTPGFLDYVFAMGAVGGAGPTSPRRWPARSARRPDSWAWDGTPSRR